MSIYFFKDKSPLFNLEMKLSQNSFEKTKTLYSITT